jgi:hypothetical protein
MPENENHDQKAALDECVQRKIPILIQEGYDRDQAVAIAYAMCGERAADLAGETKLIAFGGAVKALKGQRGRVGGYLVMWGDASRRDLEGEYFTPETDLGLDWFPARPALYHHGLDGTIGPVKIGQIDLLTPDDTGVWVEAQLDLRHRYVDAVLALVEKEALGWSSGTLPQLVRVERGKITRWPIVEGSLTPTPAEPRITVVPLKALLDLPRLEGLATKAAVPIEAAAEGAATESPDPAVSPADSGDTTPPVEAPAAPDAAEPGSPPAGTTETVVDAGDPGAGGPPPGSPSSGEAEPDDHSPDAAEEQAGDSEEHEETDMDPKQLAMDVIAATLQALGITDLSDEQKQALVDAVLAQLQPEAPPAGAPEGTLSADPAEFGKAAAKAAFGVVQGFLAQREAQKAARGQIAALQSTIQPESPAPEGFEATPSPRIQVRTASGHRGSPSGASWPTRWRARNSRGRTSTWRSTRRTASRMPSRPCAASSSWAA